MALVTCSNSREDMGPCLQLGAIQPSCVTFSRLTGLSLGLSIYERGLFASMTRLMQAAQSVTIGCSKRSRSKAGS